MIKKQTYSGLNPCKSQIKDLADKFKFPPFLNEEIER